MSPPGGLARCRTRCPGGAYGLVLGLLTQDSGSRRIPDAGGARSSTAVRIPPFHPMSRQSAMPLIGWSDTPSATAVSGNQSQVLLGLRPDPPGVGLAWSCTADSAWSSHAGRSPSSHPWPRSPYSAVLLTVATSGTLPADSSRTSPSWCRGQPVPRRSAGSRGYRQHAGDLHTGRATPRQVSTNRPDYAAAAGRVRHASDGPGWSIALRQDRWPVSAPNCLTRTEPPRKPRRR